MGRTIEHFIWGYQLLFRVSQECRAKTLFQSLDERFNPEVFVVGVLAEERQDRYSACVEPEEDFWIESEVFKDVLARARYTVGTYPESEILQSHPVAQKRQDEGLFKRAVQDVVSEVIAAHPSKPEGIRYFPSFPVLLDGFLVSLVVGLQEEVLDSHGALQIGRVNLHEYRSYKVPVSLIDAVVDEYLSDIVGELLKPDPGADVMAGKSPDEILRAAGRRMVAGAAQRVDTCLNQEGCEGILFDAVNRIASMKHERAAAVGRLLLAREDHQGLARTLTFDSPIGVNSARAMRKLLQLASRDVAIHSNARDAWGLAAIGDYDGKGEDLYEINVLDHNHWELAHCGEPLMRVRDGLPELPRADVNSEKLRIDILRIFKGITEEKTLLVVSLAETAAKEKHGTTLVISNEAATEATRLQNEATLVRPCPLTPELLQRLTSIDGAVLLGPDGTCYAIGVILDGMATDAGNPARGARYNSAIRYIKSQNSPCMAIVVSEDGGVDVVPDLRAPIRKSAIEGVMEEMDAILAAEHVNRRRYRQLAEWLRDNRFYLQREHCERANELVASIDKRISEEDPEAPTIVQGDFEPHPEFDPCLYYEEELG